MRAHRSAIAAAVAALACSPSAPDLSVPPPPDAGVSSSQAVSTFAVRELLLGDIERGGAPSLTAWRSFGFDLDGRITNQGSSDVCALQPGAPDTEQIDGTGGIDNGWGAHVVPLLETALSEQTPSNVASTALLRGDWTLLVQITGLSDDPNQTASGLSAQIFVGAQTAQPPAFDSTTNWPLRPSSVADSSVVPFVATVQFKEAYVTHGTFVARGSDAPLVVPLELGAFGNEPVPDATFPLVIRDPVVTFVHAKPGSAEGGTIAGVLDTEAFIAGLRAFAAKISLSLCGSAFEGTAQEMRQAQDILSDGSNAPGVSCDAISLGIGFTGARVANPTTLGVDPVLADPCADAGTD